MRMSEQDKLLDEKPRDDYVYALIDGILKAQGPKSFIFSNSDGDHVIPFSLCLSIEHKTKGDFTVGELKNLKSTREVQKIQSVHIPRWLAEKLDLDIMEED